MAVQALPSILWEKRRPMILVGLAVFLCALIWRLLFWSWRGMALSPDSADYLLLAQNMLTHGRYSLEPAAPFTASIRRAPFYPFFLAALAWLRGAPPLAMVVAAQIVFDAWTAVGVFWLSRRIVSLKLAVAAGLFYGLYPGAIVAATTILTETIFTFLLTVAICLACLGLERNRVWPMIWAGMLIGLAVLCRPIALLIPLVIILAGAFSIEARRPLRPVLALCAATALTLAPWLIRCHRVAGQFVLVQSAGGAVNFYVPTLVDLDQKDEARLWPYFLRDDPYGQRLVAARTPAESLAADRFGVRQAWRNILARPTDYLRSRRRTYPYLFLTSFDSLTGINQSWRALVDRREPGALFLKFGLLLLFSLIPLILGFVGLFFSGRRVAALLCAGVWLYTLLIHLPMWIEYRFWVPGVPFLLVSAASALAGIANLTRRWRTGAPARAD